MTKFTIPSVVFLLLLSAVCVLTAQVSTPSSFVCCSSSAGYQLTPGMLAGLDWSDSTLEFWVGIGDKASAFQSPVVPIQKWDGNLVTPYPIRFAWSAPFEMTAGLSDGSATYSASLGTAGGTANTIEWHHYAAIRSSSGYPTMTIYKDGVMLSGNNDPTMNSENDNSLNLEICASGQPMVITEVRIWNVVLLETEIQSRWNTRLVGNEADLYEYWPLVNNLDSGKVPAGSSLTATGTPTFYGTVECDAVINGLLVVPLSPSQSHTLSGTPTISFSGTPTPPVSETPSTSSSSNPSQSRTPSVTRTLSRTPTLSRTKSRSITPTKSSIATPSVSGSRRTPSRTPSKTPTHSASASFNPCTDCYFPVGNSRVRLESGFIYSCPTSRTSTGTLVINTAGLPTLNIPVTFSVLCTGSNNPSFSITLSGQLVEYSFGPSGFVLTDAVNGNLQYDSASGWSGTLSFRITSIGRLLTVPTYSQNIQVLSSLGLSSPLRGSFPIADEDTSGLTELTGTFPISIPMVTPFCPTLQTGSSIQGKWTADSTADGINFEGSVSSLDCDGTIIITATATYSLPGSAGAYEFEVTLDAEFDSSTRSWSGEATGETDIASVPTTLSANFEKTITSRTLTAGFSLSIGGPGVAVVGRLNYPNECDPNFPLAVGTGSLEITDFPFGLPSVFTIDDPTVTVLLSCDGMGYWGFTSDLSFLDSFSAAGLPSISLAGSLGVVIDFGCPPVLEGWSEFETVSVDVLGDTRNLVLPNTRASECEEGAIQATVFGGWSELLLMASFNFNTQQQAVRAVSKYLPSLNQIISAITGSGGSGFGDSASSNSIVNDFADGIMAESSIDDASVLFDLGEKTLTATATIRLFGVPVEALLIYQVTPKIYATGVGISSEADFSGVIGELVEDAINSLGLVDASVAITNGPVDVVLPGSDTEVSFYSKGVVVSAKINLQNPLLESIPGFTELFASLGHYLPGAPSEPTLTVLVKLEGAPSSVTVSVLLSDVAVPLTEDGKWLLTTTSFFFQTTPTSFSVGIQCDIQLTIPNDPPFVVVFLGLFSFDLLTQTINLEAGATSDQLWQPSKEVEIYVAFPWAISMGINLYIGPASIGFTGALQFGDALGSATVFIDLVEVVNSGFSFSLENFRLRDFLAVFRVTVADGSVAAELLESFSIERLAVSYSLVGYESPSGLISIPVGYFLDATNVNLFNIVKIIRLEVAVVPTSGFTFDGVIEKMKFGPLRLEHPTNTSLGPQVEMAMTPTEQNLDLAGRVTILNFFSLQGSAFLDVQEGKFASSLYFTFGNSCPSGPAVNATYDMVSSYSTSWLNPAARFKFGVLFQADFEEAVSCLIIQGTQFLVDSVEVAIDAARVALRWASDRLAEAETALKAEADRLARPSSAEIELMEAQQNVNRIQSRCDRYKCKWYRPDVCTAKAACKVTLALAKEVLSGLQSTVQGLRIAAAKLLQGLSSAAAGARSAFHEAEGDLNVLLDMAAALPGLSDGLAGDLGAFADAALRIKMVQVNGSASIDTTPEGSFSMVADLVIFGNPYFASATVSLQVKPILDKFLKKVEDDFKSLTSAFGFRRLKKRDTSSLRDAATGKLTLDTFSQESESLSYNALNWYEPLDPLEGAVPWQDICSGGFNKLFRIDLSENKLTGGIDSCIFTSIPLEVLSLRDNKMSEPVFFPAMEAPVLTSLSLAKNGFDQELTSDSGITNLVNLKALDLSNNKFRGSVKLFQHFKKLQTLNLNSNQFSDEAGYRISNLLLDLPKLRVVNYGDNAALSRGTKYQPYPFRIHGQIQVAFDYDYFCKEVELGNRWDNCRQFDLHNKDLVDDFENAISKWIEHKWEEKFSSSSSLSFIDPSKGSTHIKTILPMKTRYSGRNSDLDGGSNTALTFIYSYPNPNPTGSELSTDQKQKRRDHEGKAVRGFMRRMAKVIEEDLESLNFTSKWATLDYSEFSSRRSNLATSDIPLPSVTQAYKIKTRKAILGCPPGWIGRDCQYFCENGWKSIDRFTNQIAYQTAQNHSELNWKVLEASGSAPSCTLPTTLCKSQKCDRAVYDVYKACGRWVQDECGRIEHFPGTKTRNQDDRTNFEECSEALQDAQEQCFQESYECSGSVTDRYQELMETATQQKNYCPKKEPGENSTDRKLSDGNGRRGGEDSDEDNGDNEDDIAGWMIALIVVACVFGVVVIALAVGLALIFSKK